jgi:hypothetical protein
LIERAGDKARLLTIIMSHLIADHWSYLVLTRDLLLACDDVVKNGLATLPPKSTSVKDWGELLVRLGETGVFERELDHWLAPTRDAAFGWSAPADASYFSGRVLLEEEHSEVLRTNARAVGGSLPEILRAATAITLARSLEREAIAFNWLSGGRSTLPDGVDLSRTVGMLYRDFPQAIRVADGSSVERVVAELREADARIDNEGLGYSVLTWFGRDAEVRERLRAHPAQEIRVNYVGDTRALAAIPDLRSFRRRPSVALRGAERGPRCRIEIVFTIQGGRIAVSVVRRAANARAAQHLANHLADTLRATARRCRGGRS